jgi:hypothetical protein
MQMKKRELTPGEKAFKEGEEALNKRNLTLAERAYNRALVHFTRDKDLIGIGGTLYNLGRIHHLRSEYKKALSSYLLAKSIFYQLDPPVVERIEEDIRQVKASLGDEEYEKLSVEINKGLQDKTN